MYATQMEAYKNTHEAGCSAREVEANVLTKAALQLKACQDEWQAADRDHRLHEAVRFNQMIWSIFQGELAQPDCPLPKTVRQDILSLSVFIDKRLLEILAYPAPDKLTAVININLNIAAGLRGAPK